MNPVRVTLYYNIALTGLKCFVVNACFLPEFAPWAGECRPLWGFLALSSATKPLQNFRECCRQQRKCSKTSGSAVVSDETPPKSPGALSSATKPLQNLRECCRQRRKCSKTSGSAVVSDETSPKSLGALSSTAKPLQNLRERCRQRRNLSKISGSAVVNSETSPKSPFLRMFFIRSPNGYEHLQMHSR